MELTQGGKASGSCLCKRVRFQMTMPSRFCGHCHCANCRRAHGAAFVTWVGFDKAQVQITAGEEVVTRYETETEAIRTFCSRCGSTLFFESPRWSGETHVALANVEDPIDRAPSGHCYVDHRASWWTIDDTLPQSGGETGMEKK
jgi:hypothetical protein